jgi:hypothetical protein
LAALCWGQAAAKRPSALKTPVGVRYKLSAEVSTLALNIAHQCRMRKREQILKTEKLNK